MGKSRFYSLALGKEKNFQARTDGLITDADTTPSIDIFSLLYSNSANNITYFNNAVEGQLVKVINIADQPLDFSGAQMLVSNSGSLWQNDTIEFIFHNSSFYELGRSPNANAGRAIAAAGDASPSVKNAKVLLFDSAGAITVTDFDDGSEGQLLTVINLGTAVTISNGTIILGRSDQAYIITTSDSTQFIRESGTWFNIGIAATAV